MEKKTIKGLPSLLEAVKKDCKNGENCFNENFTGCTKVRHRTIPEDNPRLKEMGFKTKCVSTTKCTHDYCGKLKWILERADHYAEKTGKTREQILEAWENDRTYWYMNYYQESKQPELNSDKIISIEDFINQLETKYGKDRNCWLFKCPNCGHVQSVKDFYIEGVDDPLNTAMFNCIGRYEKGKGCDWSLGGLFQIHKLAVLKDGKVHPVFEIA